MKKKVFLVSILCCLFLAACTADKKEAIIEEDVITIDEAGTNCNH